jgi:hypothetical protein
MGDHHIRPQIRMDIPAEGVGMLRAEISPSLPPWLCEPDSWGCKTSRLEKDQTDHHVLVLGRGSRVPLAAKAAFTSS